MKSANPRWIALQVVLQLVERGRSLDEQFAGDWFQSLNADRRDLALSRELAFGLCRWYFVLLPLLQTRLQKPLRARDRDIEIILLLGLYQLLVMHTEAHAAVNETVNLARLCKKVWARGLINAILRGVVRDGIRGDQLDQAASYPDWMLHKIEQDWPTRAEQVLAFGNARPPMTLRVAPLAGGRDAMLAEFEAAGMQAMAHDTVQSAILLSSPCDVADLPGFAEGRDQRAGRFRANRRAPARLCCR